MNKALILLSGGQDSTTCFYWAKKKFDSIQAIGFNYGQRHVIEIDFAKKLSRLGTVFVNDAFGSAHRAHGSTCIIAQFFSKKYFGKLLEKEVASIRKVIRNGKKPVLAIIGGAKISTKITIIESLMNSVTDILIGGGMAYTFIKAQGGSIGDSICEKDFCDYSIPVSYTHLTLPTILLV